MSYLYLLVDGAGDGFKIGVSTDPSQRMASLPERIDVTKSFQIKCGEKNSYRVEKTLHLLFRNHHLKKERGDGYTEWFSMDCFEAVQDFIRSQRDLLGWTHFEPIPKPTVRHNSVNRTDEEKANRKVDNAEKKKAEFIEYLERNQKNVTAMSDWIGSIRESNALIGKFTTEYGGTALAILRLDESDELDLNAQFDSSSSYAFLNKDKFCGGMSLLGSIMAAATSKYRFVGLGDFDNFFMRNDEFIQPLLKMIENIPFISEPQLSGALDEYNKILEDILND
jgi:hypothetical protein